MSYTKKNDARRDAYIQAALTGLCAGRQFEDDENEAASIAEAAVMLADDTIKKADTP